MKCPKCSAELTAAVRHKLPVAYCAACHGMWLERQELGQLEDEVFFLGDHAKGTLVDEPAPTDHKCPECSAALTEFNYRFNDLRIEACTNGHGYWLDETEDDRILAVMKKEQLDSVRAIHAEDKWSNTLKHLRSPSFLDKVRDLLR